MKRPTLAGRAAFLFEHQDNVARAAHDFSRVENNSMSKAWEKEKVRRDLYQASLALGVAMRRYLGGA